MEQVVAKERKKVTVLNEDEIHFPSSSRYSLKSIYDDLLTFSVKHLKIGGRLVCWFPITKDDYNEDLLPKHSAFELVANSEQRLNGEATRRLLTYEKIQDSGALITAEELEDFDFRMRYFAQGEVSTQDRRMAIHERNVYEAKKRGKHIEGNFESKKKANKRILLERVKQIE